MPRDQLVGLYRRGLLFSGACLENLWRKGDADRKSPDSNGDRPSQVGTEASLAKSLILCTGVDYLRGLAGWMPSFFIFLFEVTKRSNINN